MENSLIKDSLFSTIKNLYLKIIGMEELVWVSSMAWIFWTVDQLFPKQKDTIAIIFILLLGIILISTIINVPKTDFKSAKFWRKSFMRLFNIPGSLLFLFLFLNSFLKFSEPINQKFLTAIKSLEGEISLTLFAGFIFSILIFVFFHFLILLKKYLKGEITGRKVLWKEITSIILIIIVLLPFFFSKKIYISFYAKSFIFLLKWFFGISLLFLHVNYLLEEFKIFLRKSLGTVKIRPKLK